jgi:hypothetical protein
MRLSSEPCFDGFRANSLMYESFDRGNLLADTPASASVLPRHSTGKFVSMPNSSIACDAEVESVAVGVAAGRMRHVHNPSMHHGSYDAVCAVSSGVLVPWRCINLCQSC